MTRNTFDSFAIAQAERFAEYYLEHGTFLDGTIEHVCKGLLIALEKYGWRKQPASHQPESIAAEIQRREDESYSAGHKDGVIQASREFSAQFEPQLQRATNEAWNAAVEACAQTIRDEINHYSKSLVYYGSYNDVIHTVMSVICSDIQDMKRPQFLQR